MASLPKGLCGSIRCWPAGALIWRKSARLFPVARPLRHRLSSGPNGAQDRAALGGHMRRTVKTTRRHILRGAAATLAAPALVRAARADAAYPTRPVHVIIPYPPAGGADTTGRIFF